MKVVFDATEVERAVLRYAQAKVKPKEGQEIFVIMNWRGKCAFVEARPKRPTPPADRLIREDSLPTLTDKPAKWVCRYCGLTRANDGNSWACVARNFIGGLCEPEKKTPAEIRTAGAESSTTEEDT